jgi:hypothetical protein
MSSEEIGIRLAEEGRGSANRNTIKTHIWQMNEALAETDYQLVADRRRPYRWCLVKRKVRAA